MDVALIRIDLKHADEDGRPKILSWAVVDTSLKVANETKPEGDDLLALTRTKYRSQFLTRSSFPFNFDATNIDSTLEQWAKKIDPTYGTVKVKVSELSQTEVSKLKVLANTIVLASDPDCIHDKQIMAVGNYVYVRCRKDADGLPSPVLLMESANHYLFQEFCVLTQGKLEKILGSAVYIPCTSKDKTLNAIKTKLESGGSAETYRPVHTNPINADAVVGRMTDEKLEQFCTRLPSSITKLLREISETEHVPMNRIITDCILSKYGDWMSDA